MKRKVILVKNWMRLTFRKDRPLVLFDKDGTLVKDEGYVHKVDEFVWHENGLQLLKLASKAKARIYVVTNQSGISKGRFTKKQSIKFARHLILRARSLGICVEAVVICPHEEEANCECRKPRIGMYTEVNRISRTRTSRKVMIGNTTSDEQFASNLESLYIDVDSKEAKDLLMGFLRD